MLATIGYERAELGDFIATLSASNVDILVDIRDRAQSRRPGFSKSALADALGKAGIEYIHLRALGDPKEGREAARRGDFQRFRAIFHEVLRSDAAQTALSQLEKLADKNRICLMCFERDQLQCHRKIVSDHLERVLSKKARHLGVSKGVGRQADERRMRHSHKGATASLQSVF